MAYGSRRSPIWATTSHGAPTRPTDLSLPDLMSAYRIDRVGLLKSDIEGGEFAVFADRDLSWLEKVDQLALEKFTPSSVTLLPLSSGLSIGSFAVDLRDNDDGQIARRFWLP